ncbi:MAG: divergent polysaccharide deacetylase family protein [Chitinophagales bacterium]
MRRNRAGFLALLFLVLAAIAAGCATAPAWRRTERAFLPGVAERAVTEIDAALLRMGVAPAEVRRDERQEDASLDQPAAVTWSRWVFTLVAFPTFRHLTPEDYAQAVREGARLAGGEAVTPGGRRPDDPLRLVVRVPVKAGGRRFKVEALEVIIRQPDRETGASAPPASRPAGPAAPEPEPAGGAPRVALIIDDWGYEQPFATDFFNLPVPLTMAVIPFLPASERLAKAGQAHGWEVILHLPMEAEQHEYESTKGLVRVDMTDAEVRTAVDRALDAMPEADGVNNHMGSLATQNPRVMRVALEEIAARRLFFVDSRTSPASVAAGLAKERGMAFGENALFLDNQRNVEYIREQLNSLVSAARTVGYAIGIGHVRRETLSALQLELPELIRAGVRFVPARDVVATDFRRPVRSGGARRSTSSSSAPASSGQGAPPVASPAVPPAVAPKAHPPAAPSPAQGEPSTVAPAPAPAPSRASSTAPPVTAGPPSSAPSAPAAEAPAPGPSPASAVETAVPAPEPAPAEPPLSQSAGNDAPAQEL